MDDASPRRWRPGVADALLLAALSALALSLGLAPITNNDIWLHLATGDWILSQGAVPRTEIFSFVAAGRPYIAHEWGSQVLLAGIYAAAGLAGLVGYKTGIALLLSWALFAGARTAGAPPARAALAAAVGLFVAGAHLWARPHLLTWLALLACLALLSHARRQPRWLLALIPLQIVWTNLHGGFILGPAMAATWGVGRWLEARGRGPGATQGMLTLATAAAMALACMVNPYGLRLVSFPFQLTASSLFMEAVYEWRSPFTSGYVNTTMFALFVVMGMAWLMSALTGRKEGDLPRILVTAGLAVLALRMNRNVPLFMLAAVPAAALAFPSRRHTGQRRERVEITLVALLLAGTTLLVAFWGYPYGLHRFRPLGLGLGPRVPAAACDTLERLQVQGNAFTTYGEGAYTAWRLWPRVQISMDSRNSVYGEDLYLAYRQALRSAQGMKDYLRRWPVDLAVVAHMGPFRHGYLPDLDRDADLPHRGLLADAGLLLLDFDDATAAYIRPGADSRGTAAAEAYRIIHPVLAWSGFPAGDLPGAITEARRAVERRPRSVAAHWILANALAQAGETHAALAQLQAIEQMDTAAVARSWGVPHTLDAARLGLEAFMHQQRHDCPAARRALEKALRHDPDYQPANDLLAHLDC